ncbi:M20 aminoacylase family protein [Roseibaca calidilacus]|nr:M20 aminoacylase family protein [Roseibaca calidilacus]CUX80131.1 hippurate hydrolase [Roseibaca calidilacus]
MQIPDRIEALLPQITALRQDLHAHPEILFDCHRTSATVADFLRKIGCDAVETGIGRTGVVGLIHGRNGPGRCIGLRADMDALPIHEATGLPYASREPGKMHACGHDGHTAMLLGAAQYLAETRAFDGTVAVIFQPAEEGGGGGREMCEDGLMDRFAITEVYGMHNWPGVPTGTFAIRPGAFFAATDQFEIAVEGRGGHAAKPHHCVDTTVVAAHIVLALQSIVSRNADPTQEMVVSVTSFATESQAFNVIPQHVILRGTVRTLSKDMRALAEDRLPKLAEMTAQAYGATARVTYMRGYPVMVNTDAETEYAMDAARAVAGDCATAPLVMGGEDFAYMLEERPGAYILVGNGDSADVHHPEYNFNDSAIPAGCAYWAELVARRLPLRTAA